MSSTCFPSLVLLAILSPALAAEPNLALWLKAEDLKLADGAHVVNWPDASGSRNHCKAEEGRAPVLAARGAAGRPAVVFSGDAKSKQLQYLDVPMAGEYQGITAFAVGKGLAGPGWLDTAPGGNGCLRTCGWMQLTGTQCGADGFKGLAVPGLELAQLSLVNGEEGLTFRVLSFDKVDSTKVDKAPRYGVIFRNAHLGTNNTGETQFNGAIVELLVYLGNLEEKDRLAVERYLMVKHGMAQRRPGDPQGPVGVKSPGVARAKAPGGPIRGKPVAQGLRLWAAADDLQLKDGELVEQWPVREGKGPLTASGANRPTYLTGTMNGWPSVKFDGDWDNKGKVVKLQYLRLPLDGLKTDEMTLFIAGKDLARNGVFDTYPGRAECFRVLDWVQLCGNDLSISEPFPSLRGMYEPQILGIVLGKTADRQHLAAYADGSFQKRKESTNPKPVVFQGGTVGTNNMGETFFTGEIAEILIYDRALTAPERRQVEEYLGSKYGVVLPDPAQAATSQPARSRWSTRLPAIPHTMSWFGNSFSGKTQWVQSGFSDSIVLPTGNLAAICIWDEMHHEITVYGKEGQKVNGIGGGGAVLAADARYLYAAVSGMGKKTQGVRRLTFDLKEAKWESGWPTWSTPEIWCEAVGLAVDGDTIYVSTDRMDVIVTIDKNRGKIRGRIPFEKPGKLAADGKGNLWVGAKEGLVQVGARGQSTGKAIRGIAVGAARFDSKGRLLVADKGQLQQILVYDVSGEPKLVAAFGDKGGVFSPPKPGAMGPKRLAMPSAVSVDSAGNLCFSCTRFARVFSPAGDTWDALRWQVHVTEFCTTADFDPASDGTEILTGHCRYSFHPGKEPGQDWELTGWNEDARAWPELTDSGGQVLVRRLNGGKLYKFGIGSPLRVHRQVEGTDLFAPCGAVMLQHNRRPWHDGQMKPAALPDMAQWAWCDRNGDGRIASDEVRTASTTAGNQAFQIWVDDNGGIWETQDRDGLRYLPLSGFTNDGAPIYEVGKLQYFPRPREFIEVYRAWYYPATDTLYLSGVTWDHPALGKEHWGGCGREAIRYDGWLRGDRRVVSRMVFPKGAVSIKAAQPAHAGNRFFAGEMETSVLFVYDTASGKLLGIVEPDERLFGSVGWIDTDSAVRPFVRSNGEILVICEESAFQKQMIYRLPPAK
jgi:hypothetical protein